MHNKSWLWFAAGLLVIGALFEAGQEEFEAAADVGKGLGPVFNDVSCVACHSNPKVGGDSNITETRFGRITKGAFDPMTERGGFLPQVRGVDPGRGCGPEIVPPEATIIAKRKTTSLFGLGLVDNVPDTTFLDIARAQQTRTPEVAGQPSIVKDVTSGRHRLGRFGWKAQVATLMTFAADAYLNEMGITSPTFPKKNLPNGDASRLEQCNGLKSDPEDHGDAVAAFTDFMMFLAPPPRGPITTQVTAGQAVFEEIGCATCHVRRLTTGPSPIVALDRVTFEPFSDFLLHDMGSLGDSIEQGAAGGRQMRTAPLWGLRVRTTYLHDGRASSVEAAILAHDGQGRGAMREYTHLDDAGKRALRAFLQSL